MKKLLVILALLIPGVAAATCNPFVPNTVLTASALNAAIAGPCITSGTITGAAISGVSLDGSTVGATTPSSVFGTYFKSTGLDASNYSAEFYSYGTGTTNAGLAVRTARGTSTAPTATQTTDVLGNVDFWGYGTAWAYSASIDAVAVSTFTGSNYQSQLNFNTTALNGTAPVNVFNVSNGGANALFGVNSSGAFTGTYTDGLVTDYATGNGRISVGGSDTLSIYTGGIANTMMAQFAATGMSVVGGGGYVAYRYSIISTVGRAVNIGTVSDTLAASTASTFESANTASSAFTVTIAAPTVDGERRRICFKNATGTITWTPTAPATATNGLPTSMAAGQCVEMVYNSAAGSPTNSAATTWYVY